MDLWTEDPNYLSNKEVHLIFHEDVNLILEFLLCLLLAKTWAMGASIRGGFKGLSIRVKQKMGFLEANQREDISFQLLVALKARQFRQDFKK